MKIKMLAAMSAMAMAAVMPAMADDMVKTEIYRNGAVEIQNYELQKHIDTLDPAHETVITKTTTYMPHNIEGAHMIDFMAFDENGDGFLTMEEVGERLFYVFDRDGNQVIDNIEFARNSMVTVAPMEKETVTMVDRYGDGIVEYVTFDYDTFMKRSQLSRFDGDNDGLSPKEFAGMGFLEMDRNNDTVIDLNEWKEAYTAIVFPEVARQERYNN